MNPQNSCSEPSHHYPQDNKPGQLQLLLLQQIVGATTAVIGTFGIIGNLLSVMLLVHRYLRGHIFRVYMFALSAVDCTVLVSSLFMLAIPRLLGDSVYHSHALVRLITIFYPIGCAARTASCWLVATMTMVRFLSVTFPFLMHRHSSVRFTMTLIALTISLAVLINAGRILELHLIHCPENVTTPTLHYIRPSLLRDKPSYRLYYKAIFIGTMDFVLPFSLIATFNAKTAIRIILMSACEFVESVHIRLSRISRKSTSACGENNVKRPIKPNDDSSSPMSSDIKKNEIEQDSPSNTRERRISNLSRPPNEKRAKAKMSRVSIQALQLKRKQGRNNSAGTAERCRLRHSMQGRQSSIHTVSHLLASICIIFLLCHILPVTTNILEILIHFQPSKEYTRNYKILTELGNLTVCINASLNFIIYLLFCPRFRREFLNALPRFCQPGGSNYFKSVQQPSNWLSRLRTNEAGRQRYQARRSATVDDEDVAVVRLLNALGIEMDKDGDGDRQNTKPDTQC